MNIVEVKTEQCYRYIPLKGWASVEAALKTYSNGFVKGSRDTSDKQERDIRQAHGGLAEALFVVTSLHLGREGSIDDEILPEAKKALAERDSWQKHFDYDGMGTPFFKTTVEIKVIDREQDLYGLGFYAAYVGDKPEEGLAEYLEIPRTFLWSSIIIQADPVGDDRFSFDFEQIIRKLDDILGTSEIGGEAIAQAMMRYDDCNGHHLESKPGFVIKQEEDLRIFLSPGRVQERFPWHDPFGPERRQLDTWSIDGSVLTGFLAESYSDRTKKEPPTLVISLSNHFLNSWGMKENLPVWQPEKKERIIALTNQIVEALK
jgi:hypothetical protein